MMRAYKAPDGLRACVEYKYKETIKAMGGQWDPFQKEWVLPYALDVWQGLLMAIPGIEGDAAVKKDFEAPVAVEKKIVSDIGPMPLKAGITPFEHQYAAYAEAMTLFHQGRCGYGFFFEMGCGKSLTAVAVAGQLYLEQQVRTVLIVAPLSVIPVWPREFGDYAGYPYSVTVLDDRSRKKKLEKLKAAKGKPGLCVVAINYESCWRLEDELLAFGFDMVIADEGQRIKDPLSKQSKALHHLGDQARYKLNLTGTPVSNSPLDYFSQYRFMDREIFGESWYAFRGTYAFMGQGTNHATGKTYSQVIGYRNLGDLVTKAHSIAYRVTKEQALDLPDQLDETLYCHFEPPAARAYKDLVKDSIAELDNLPAVTAQHVITQLLRLSQICGGFVKLDTEGYENDPNAGKLIPISQAKIKLFEELLGDLLAVEGKKVVVFARFTAEINRLREVLEKQLGTDGYRMIDGSVPKDVRGEYVEDFQKNPTIRVFLAQIQTAGLGITLTAADTTVYYSTDYSYAAYEQSRARTHRIGQKNNCTYLHLVVKDTVDEKILEALSQKKSIADLCVDNYQQLLGGTKK